MLTTFLQSFKTVVQAQNEDLPLGLLIDMVVNPNTGVFEAFWIKSLDGSKLLLPKDILSWNHEQITIKDQSDLTLPEKLPRLSKVFDQECPILKNHVFDEALNKDIGVVRDFTFDTLSPRLLSLEIKNGFLHLSRQRIPQHHILSITNNRITVNTTLLKKDSAKAEISEKLKVLEVPNLDGPRRKQK